MVAISCYRQRNRNSKIGFVDIFIIHEFYIRPAMQTYMIDTNIVENWRDNGNCFRWNLFRKYIVYSHVLHALSLLSFMKKWKESLWKEFYRVYWFLSVNKTNKSWINWKLYIYNDSNSYKLLYFHFSEDRINNTKRLTINVFVIIFLFAYAATVITSKYFAGKLLKRGKHCWLH